MGEVTVDPQPINIEHEVPVQGQIFNNVKRLKAGDGSWRFENGSLIISDETGIDRVLIGFGEGLF